MNNKFINIKEKIMKKVLVGMFDYNTYGADLNLFYPFKDERFSLEGRIGYVGFGW